MVAPLLTVLIVAATATIFYSRGASSQASPPPPLAGDPLPGLTVAQQEAFIDGLDEFTNEETPEGGLGPLFNQTSCVACHSAAGPGGASAVTVTRFGRIMRGGRFDPFDNQGGSLLQRFAITPELQEVVPREASVVAQRVTTPLFGLGLIEAIPDATLIEAAARSNKPDGVRGRAAVIVDVETGKQRIGRLGWKAQHASVLAFAADAYTNEMGITNRFFPLENAPNGKRELLARFNIGTEIEDVADPETGLADIDKATNFIRFLAPLTRPALSASARAGEAVFEQTGCSVPHTRVTDRAECRGCTGSQAGRALLRPVVA